MPFITNKWEACVCTNLNSIFVCDALIHPAAPCSQSSVLMQFSYVEQVKCSWCVLSMVEAPQHMKFSLLLLHWLSKLVLYSWPAWLCKAICQLHTGFTVKVWKNITLSLCISCYTHTHTHTPLPVEILLRGAVGHSETLLEIISQEPEQVTESYWNNCVTRQQRESALK